MTVKREAMARYLTGLGFRRLPGGTSSHVHFIGPGDVKVTLPGHGRHELAPPTMMNIIRTLESLGIDRGRVRRELAAL